MSAGNDAVVALAGVSSNKKSDVLFIKTATISAKKKNADEILIDGGTLVRADPFMEAHNVVQIKDWIFLIDVPTFAGRLLRPEIALTDGYIAGYHDGYYYVFDEIVFDAEKDPALFFLGWILENIYFILCPPQ